MPHDYSSIIIDGVFIYAALVYYDDIFFMKKKCSLFDIIAVMVFLDPLPPRREGETICYKKIGESMSFLLLFKSMPLPFLTLFLPLAGSGCYGLLLLYNKFFSRRLGHTLVLPKVCYKLPFLILLVAGTVLSCLVWMSVSGSYSPLYVFTSTGWSNVLTSESVKNAQAVLRIDAFGAISAALMSFVALTAGIRALADRQNLITPRKVFFLLLTCAGIQGIFYLNNLVPLFLFMLLTQIGVTGLYSNFATKKREGGESVFYYISRVLLLAMFLAGVILLRFKYGTDNINLLASMIAPANETLWAFIFLVVPLLYIFVKPSPYLPDASRNCFFGIRTQASLFIAFRVIFSLYGPMQGLQKVPMLLILLGFAAVLLALVLSCGAKDPERFMNSMVFYMKGMILISIGIAMDGTFSAERAALYGVSAIEAMISLWLMFLPVSAALSIITVFLKQSYEGRELWQEGALLKRIPFTAVALFIVIAVLAGLPPLIGYSGKQLLFRSANFMSPFVLTSLFLFTVTMLLTGLRFLITLTIGKVSQKRDFNFSGEVTIAFPLFLLLMLFITTTVLPGELFEESVAPSVESLINRTAPSDLTPVEVSK